MSLLTEITETVEQGTDLWRQIRLGKFTSSRIKELVCKRGDITKTALSYIAEKAAEIITGEEQMTFESEDMIWGKEHEPIAAKIYQDRTGFDVSTCGFVLHNEFYGGSPDRLVEPAGLLEIKCPKSKNHIKNCMADSQEMLKKINEEAYYQIQSNLFLTDRLWVHFVSYDPRVKGAEFYMLHIKRDEKVIEEILNSVEIGTVKLQEVLTRMRTTA